MDKRLRQGLVVIDGGFGTLLQAAGLPAGHCPEEWNLAHPDKVIAIHRDYALAGALVMSTNTFGGNRIKLAEYGMAERVAEFNAAAVKCARQAGDVLVTGSMGPTGRLMPPMGDFTFLEAVEVFREQAAALAAAGADLISLETFADVMEARAAFIGARRACQLPIIVQMTYDANGRTLTGSTPQVIAGAFSSLSPLAVGCNCGMGPQQMLPVVHAYAAAGMAPIVALPNAGLPELVDGKTMFRMTPAEYAGGALEIVRAGARFIGGCCGTTPAHIAALVKRLGEVSCPPDPAAMRGTVVTSRRRVVVFGTGTPFAVIGERINPTGKPALQEALKAQKLDMVAHEAREQAQQGAHILDVNVGAPGVDETAVLPAAVAAVEAAIDLPVAIDTTSYDAFAAALARCPGKPLVNSVSAEPEKLEKWLPLIREFGAATIVLALQGKSLPATVTERLAAVEKVIVAARAQGIPLRDLVIDVLALTVSARPAAAEQALDAIRAVKNKWPEVSTSLGVSNVSFGLPRRSDVNAAFLAQAVAAGLDAGIINPGDQYLMRVLAGAELLAGRDPGARRFVRTVAATGGEAGQAGWTDAARAVIDGDGDAITPKIAAELARGRSALAVINEDLIPSITEVGEKYNRGEYFLPQLMLAAEAMQRGFAFLKPKLAAGEQSSRGTVILATVKNDIHDIGKNIVKVMVENSGFKVVDLGKDVTAEAVAEAAHREKADAVGLSALMTTTMTEMPRAAQALNRAGFTGMLMVGGAVVTKGFAAEFGAHYAADAVGAVKLLHKAMKK